VATFKKYDFNGQEIGEETIDDNYLQSNANGQLIKEYIVAIRQNQRQWSANTKVRHEVNHSNKKPHRQKGLGRSRQGSLAAPHYRGGGRVGGPRPKFDQHIRINKKERRAAIKFLFKERVEEGKVIVLQSDMILKATKTKRAYNFLGGMQMLGSRVLILSNAKSKDIHQILNRSVNNIQKVEVVHVPVLNGYDLACSQHIIIMDYSLDL